MQDLLTENEEHFIDLIENTERFLQDIQDSGFSPQDLPPNVISDNTKAKKYMKELETMMDDFNSRSPVSNLLIQNSPYKPFASEGSKQPDGISQDAAIAKEASLVERITELQEQLQRKEEDVTLKYESIVERLEGKVRSEAQKHNETRRNYKLLVETTLNFQEALKDLQRAVRGKKVNISSYK